MCFKTYLIVVVYFDFLFHFQPSYTIEQNGCTNTATSLIENYLLLKLLVYDSVQGNMFGFFLNNKFMSNYIFY